MGSIVAKENILVWTDNALYTMKYVGAPYTFEFEQVGTLESWNSDGLRSLIKTMPHVPNMIEKTLRYPGCIEYIKVLRESGFFSYDEIEVALSASNETGIKIDRILLDNFSHAEVKEAVNRYSDKIVLEASGGITPDNVRGYGEAGVEFVSMGYMTHSVKSLDLSLKSTPYVR